MNPKSIVLKSFAAAVFGVFSLQATAAVITYDLDIVFSTGAVAPDGPTPYATVTFDDGGGIGTVDMTVAIAGTVGDAKMTELYLNFDPILDLSQLSFNYDGVVSTGPQAAVPVGVGTDAFKADGDGLYELVFENKIVTQFIEPVLSDGDI